MNESNQPAKQSNNTILLIIVFVLIAIALWRFGGIGSSDDVPTVRATSRPVATTAPTTYSIRYVVRSNGRAADVTYENDTGNTEQKDNVNVGGNGWELTMAKSPGDFFYISAQSADDATRTISCEVYQNGVLVESAESTGKYVIATCSGSAGD